MADWDTVLQERAVCVCAACLAMSPSIQACGYTFNSHVIWTAIRLFASLCSTRFLCTSLEKFMKTFVSSIRSGPSLKNKAHFSGSFVYFITSKATVSAFVVDKSETYLTYFLSCLVSFLILSFFPSAFVCVILPLLLSFFDISSLRAFFYHSFLRSIPLPLIVPFLFTSFSLCLALSCLLFCSVLLSLRFPLFLLFLLCFLLNFFHFSTVPFSIFLYTLCPSRVRKLNGF